MLDTISARGFNELAGAVGDHLVSIYLPTHQTGAETAQDSIRLKNLASTAAAELVAVGRHTAEVDALLADVTALHNDAMFWAHVGRGLAVLVGPARSRFYRLADPVEELVVVADRFHLRPLLASVESTRAFAVLALSENRIRLLRGDRFGLAEQPLGDVPASMADALRFDDREPQLHSHSAGRVGAGRVTAAMHGQGGHKDAHDADVARFLKAVDAEIIDAIGGRSTPLVLAGVDTIVAHFRHLTGYPRVVDGSVSGNADRRSPGQLHEAAWPLVEAVLAADRDRAMATVRERRAPIVDDLAETLVAANQGRVRHLFVAAGLQQWGSFDPDAHQVKAHAEREAGDRDLIDIAAVATFAHGGNVYVVDANDIPGDAAITAVLRF
jgi:hypothetical protein